MLLQHGDPAFRRRRRRAPGARVGRACLFLVLLQMLPLSAGAPAADAGLPPSIEYQIKASFVYTVAKFVDWPEVAFSTPNSPLVFGILGSDTAFEAIEATLRGKRVHDRELIVRRLTGLGAARDCQILYISEGDPTALATILDRIDSTGVLTVGERSHFAASGGVLGLSLQESLVQFEVNMAAAQRAGLTISSKILRLGKVVKDDGRSAEARP